MSKNALLPIELPISNLVAVDECVALLPDPASLGLKDWDWSKLAGLFYQHLSPADWHYLQPADRADALLKILDLAVQRSTAAPSLRFRVQDNHLIFEVINDDMPFLVDSMTAVLNQAGLSVRLVVHPILRVQRDANGRLLQVQEPLEQGNAATDRLESWQQFYLNGVLSPAEVGPLTQKITKTLQDIRQTVEDWQGMRDRLNDVRARLQSSAGRSVEELQELDAFLAWLDDGHFTFLGYRTLTYQPSQHGQNQQQEIEERLSVVGGSGLGLLRDDGVTLFAGARRLAQMPVKAREFLLYGGPLSVTKTSQLSPVHRPVLMDAIGIRFYDQAGELQELCWFIGLYTSAAYVQSIRDIPVLRQKIARIFVQSGFLPQSHNAKALIHILETLPRDELLQMDDQSLYRLAMNVLYLQDRQSLALFVRYDALYRFASCIIYLPRPAYNTALEQRLVKHLGERFGGQPQQLLVQAGDSALMRLHLVVRADSGQLQEPDVELLEQELQALSQSWQERLELLIQRDVPALLGSYTATLKDGFSLSYQERFTPEEAVGEIPHLLALSQEQDLLIKLDTNLLPSSTEREQRVKLKLFQHASPVALADITPLLDRMGIRLINENPFRFVVRHVGDDGAMGQSLLFLNDITVAFPAHIALDRDLADRLTALLHDLWHHRVENDPLNQLVMTAGLTGREVTVLRAYLKWFKQLGAAYNEPYVQEGLLAMPQVAVHFVKAFHARFDPNAVNLPLVRNQISLLHQVLGEQASREQERVLRCLAELLQATVRTNCYQTTDDGQAKPYLSLKILGSALEWLPIPHPFAEIFVYSPVMEGVHLRGGRTARGGIRWSDRREDFRQEVLGLVKAQVVKNVVIVPVGAKGGFVLKTTPAEHESLADLGKQAYDLLIRGMLDITDNLVGGQVVPPPLVVRHDEDDTYLVVAADKGTATFSDRANAIAAEYGFWLGDAFASGGSKGYDHKKLGITSRGAWEAVKRHFRDMGRNAESEELTVVGVGDMSGDVFGNGLLLSKNIKLVAAFNHQHIFLDPNPDPASSWVERKRLFDLPRSGWNDYNSAKLSDGGQVINRSTKNVQLQPAVAEWLGLPASGVGPDDLIQALLKLPVDLLWLGGIGTYVKGADETHMAVADSVNDNLRIDGYQLGAKVVGEGANMGVTQAARTEYALAGGRINADFIDNSAGVDCSDHEVNLKILFSQAIESGKISLEERDRLFGELSDEVVTLILRNNRLQNLALSMMERQAYALLDQHAKLIRRLEQEGVLNRQANRLPSDEQLQERALRGQGLTRPELAVVMAHAKIALRERLRDSNANADDRRSLIKNLTHYFPKAVREGFAEEIAQHPLSQEIDLMLLTNSLVNRLGLHSVDQLQDATTADIADVAAGYVLVRETFGLHRCWDALLQLDGKVETDSLLDQLQNLANLVEQNCWWWLLSAVNDGGGETFSVANQLAYAEVMGALPELLSADRWEVLVAEKDALIAAGFPVEDATVLSSIQLWHSGLMVLHESRRLGLPITDGCRLRWQLEDRLQLHVLEAGLAKLPLRSVWEKRAADALRRSIRMLDSQLTENLLRTAVTRGTADSWWQAHEIRLHQHAVMLQELHAQPATDLAPYVTMVENLRGLQ
jgi:glutamate dehydrogenase